MDNKQMRRDNKKKWTKGKGNKNNKRKERKPIDQNAVGEVGSDSKEYTSNPIEWYNRYPHLLEAAARIPFPYRPGMTIPGTQNLSTKMQYRNMIPSVMSITYAPTIGNSNNNQSPISQVGKELYGKVRAAFSSDLAVDAPDLVMYLMALDSIFSNLAFMKRVYRIVNSYTPENYDIPDMLLRSMGFTTQNILDLRTNWTQGWGLLNSLILMTRKFKCPAVMDIMNRHYWMNDNVYTDAPSINSQMYIFVPSVYYTFDETSEATGTSLSVSEVQDSLIGNWNTMYTAVLAQIEALAASSDAYTISGYLKRAFDGVGDFIVDEIGQLEKFSPVYDTIVLAQIENSKSIPVTHATLQVTQDPNTNAIICQPRIMVGSAVSSDLHVPSQTINLRSDTPQVPEVVEATRLMATMSTPYTIGEVQNARDVFCATEIVEFYTVWANTGTGAIAESNLQTYQYALTQPSGQSGYAFMFAVAQLSQFDWHPAIFVCPVTGNSTGQSMFHDYYNITVIDAETLINLHRVCLYSEFNAFSII